MSGRDRPEPRLSRTDSGFRARDTEGLTLRAWQQRELRRYLQERWPHDTARSAAEALDEPLQTIRNWLEELTFPSGFKLLKLQHRLGLAFAARLDPDPEAEVRVAAMILRRRALEAELAALVAPAPRPGARS